MLRVEGIWKSFDRFTAVSDAGLLQFAQGFGCRRLDGIGDGDDARELAVHELQQANVSRLEEPNGAEHAI